MYKKINKKSSKPKKTRRSSKPKKTRKSSKPKKTRRSSKRRKFRYDSSWLPSLSNFTKSIKNLSSSFKNYVGRIGSKKRKIDLEIESFLKEIKKEIERPEMKKRSIVKYLNKIEQYINITSNNDLQNILKVMKNKLLKRLDDPCVKCKEYYKNYDLKSIKDLRKFLVKNHPDKWPNPDDKLRQEEIVKNINMCHDLLKENKCGGIYNE